MPKIVQHKTPRPKKRTKTTNVVTEGGSSFARRKSGRRKRSSASAQVLSPVGAIALNEEDDTLPTMELESAEGKTAAMENDTREEDTRTTTAAAAAAAAEEMCVDTLDNDTEAVANIMLTLNGGDDRGGDEDDDDNDDEEEEADEAVTSIVENESPTQIMERVLRSSSKQDGEQVTSKDKRIKNSKEKDVGPESATLWSEWKSYSSIGSAQEDFKNTKGFYAMTVDGKVFKVGKMCSEGQSTHDFFERLRKLTVMELGSVQVRFLDLSRMSEAGISMVETVAKFSLFELTTTNEYGMTQSMFSGKGEVYEADFGTIDRIMKLLLNYAKSRKYCLYVGNGTQRITHTSVERKKHPDYNKYVKKTSRRLHCRNDRCIWRNCGGEDSIGSYVADWINFARDPDALCACLSQNPIAGIKNKENTCYLNVVLQLVCSATGFIDRANNICEPGGDFPLTEEFLGMRLGRNQIEVADAGEFKEVFDTVNTSDIQESRFELGSFHDSQEFLLALFHCMGRDGGRPHHLRNLIKDYFGLEVVESTTCNCGEVGANVDEGYTLSVPVPIRGHDDPPVSIEDQIADYLQAEEVELTCPECGATTASRTRVMEKL